MESLFAGDSNGMSRFLERFGEHAHAVNPAAFMRKIDIMMTVRNLAPDDLAAVLSSIFDIKGAGPATVLDEIDWLSTREISVESRATLARRAAKGQVDLNWVKRTKLTDVELDMLGKSSNEAFVEYEQASDIPSRRYPGHLADRPPRGRVLADANAKVRGVAGELVARDMALPDGLKIERPIRDTGTTATDFELRARDGSIAELKVKALRPERWKQALDAYEDGSDVSDKNPVARLLKQVKGSFDRGHKVYVAVTDAMSQRSRNRLLIHLAAADVPEAQVLLLPESELLRVGKVLREHMGIPQPSVSAAGGE